VHGKTGSLGHTTALSGYIDMPSGERLAFAIFANNYNMPSRKVVDTIDEIVKTVMESAQPKGKKK